MVNTRHCIDLEKEISSLLKDGYRLDMITPADAPREVQLSKNDEVVRLILNRDSATQAPAKLAKQKGWSPGRAGMMYRDLIPSRLGGQLIASHIRITEGGEVPDYVHYHNVRFQLIYCLRGRIRVVYEDQGPPFWLEPGDCVLQPSEIRHRVLEAEAGSEVLEISSPAEHETCIDHEMLLPNGLNVLDRRFDGQRFVRHIATVRDGGSIVRSQFQQTGIFEATDGLANVIIVNLGADGGLVIRIDNNDVMFLYVISGSMVESTGGFISTSEAKLFTGKRDIILSAVELTTFLQVTIILT